ncbi:hypothetical protein GCK72_001728 [Caenorhabditis remanei]|uniref:C-type lectin domain-containing protein n=1 Tax=Caenorhabditis remanei TaxID=31234 RepID=A0A6A5HRL2_CAERE|nr:hypothetical protein GCK72_001728 [Caenorhabditis remanei]KAF1769911.1 hypothetical protein GCK72_001728 [Caenorhabditis remanei]
MRPFTLIFCLISTTLAQLQTDDSLNKTCAKMNGIWRQRSDPQSITGDTCRMNFKVSTRDKADATEFCELFAPWRLLDAEIVKESDGRQTTQCFVEATLACKRGWVQMFGHCFMRPNSEIVATYDEAKEMCDKNGGYIAFMHHRYIPGVWKRYFRGVGQIWVNATETWDQYIQSTGTVDGSALALAFTGKHFDFSVPPNSLIRINPKIKLEVLCEYKPPVTAAEINYLGRRYSEIYYPSVSVNNGILVRSASSYTRSSTNLDVCKKVLKPFLFDANSPFVPDQGNIDKLSEVKMQNKFLLTRSGAEMKRPSTGGNQCTSIIPEFKVRVDNSKVADFPVKTIEDDDKPTCDNMLSSAIVQFPGQKTKVKVMSDSRSLPIWCKLGKSVKFTYDPPEGYNVFVRSNGEVVAHKLYLEEVTYEIAKKKCAEDKAVLTGMDSSKEAEDLANLAAEKNLLNVQLWLGGRRSSKCLKINKYSEDRNDECARRRVIQWEDGIAHSQEFEDSWWKNGKTINNPDYANRNQECLTFVYGTPGWADPDSPGFLDDIGCDGELGFFCSKMVEVKIVEE